MIETKAAKIEDEVTEILTDIAGDIAAENRDRLRRARARANRRARAEAYRDLGMVRGRTALGRAWE